MCVFVSVFTSFIIFSSISMNVRVSTSVCVCVCFYVVCKIDGRMSGVCCGAAVCKDIRRLRWHLSLYCSLSLALGTTLRGFKRGSLLSFLNECVCATLSFFSYPIRTWQETISYRRCIKCVNVCVCFSSLFPTSLSRSLALANVSFSLCLCVFSLSLSLICLLFLFFRFLFSN